MFEHHIPDMVSPFRWPALSLLSAFRVSWSGNLKMALYCQVSKVHTSNLSVSRLTYKETELFFFVVTFL